MHRLSAEFGVELIRFSVADELDRLGNGLPEVEFNCPLTVHGPFLDLNPATWDSALRRVTMARFHQAHRVAKLVGAQRLVLHTGFFPRSNILEGWAPRAADFFAEFLELHNDVPIALENVFDPHWESVWEVWRRVNHRDFGLCLDAGHAHCCGLEPVTTWAERLLPALTHVHMHDNHGPRSFADNPDEHLAVGEGTLPFRPLMRILAQKPELTYTVECMTEADVLKTAEAIMEN